MVIFPRGRSGAYIPPMKNARTSAVALVLMALGLGLLYHHAPYWWAARTATIVGALLPAVYLARRTTNRVAAAAALVIAMMLCWTLVAGLFVSDPQLSYQPYQFAVVASQWLLVAIWALWWHQTRCWIAPIGGVLATGGAIMATVAHWIIGYGERIPPAPWDDPRVTGPVDMLSRVAPGLLVPEAVQIVVAGVVAAAVFAVSWLRRE
jgi:hypothetical protein